MIVHLTIDGELIETTPEHPFYTADGQWVNAEDLEVGDEIRSIDGSIGEVENITILVQTQTMYNLTIEEAHTFFVGDGEWLVHNTSKCDLSKVTKLNSTFKNKEFLPSAKNCNHCADAVLPLLQKAGYDAEIVGLRDAYNAPKILLKDMTQIADTGYHEVIQITTGGGQYYIDSVVYQSYGLQAVDWDTYHRLFAYAENEQYLIRGPRNWQP